MKGDEKEKKDKGIYKRMGGNSVRLTRKDSFRVSENLHFYFGGGNVYEEILKAISTSRNIRLVYNGAIGTYCSIGCSKIC
jgi:hypothetical protein